MEKIGDFIREQEIEQKLVKAVKSRGGLALKLTSQSMDGLPDRLLLMPSGNIAFVEVKAHGKKLRPLQVRRKKQLELLGFHCFVLDSVEQIGEILDEIYPP